MKFDQPNFFASGILSLLIYFAGSIQYHQARCVNFGAGFSYPILDGLLFGQWMSRSDLATDSLLTHQIEGTFANADPPHAMMDSAWAQALLSDHEARAFRTEQVALRHACPVVHDFAMAHPTRASFSHHRSFPHQMEARCIRWHDDLAGAFIFLCLWISDGHYDGKCRTVCSSRKPFVASDYIIVAIFHRCCTHPNWVGTGVLRLGHRKAAANITCQKWHEIFCFLLWHTMLDQDFHISSVRRLAVQCVMSEE